MTITLKITRILSRVSKRSLTKLYHSHSIFKKNDHHFDYVYIRASYVHLYLVYVQWTE